MNKHWDIRTRSNLNMRSAASLGTLSGIAKRPDRIALNVSHGSPVMDVNGGSPTIISNIRTPRAHQSAAGPCPLCMIASGDCITHVQLQVSRRF